MAKKSKKVEKETRRLIEGITDLVKKKGDKYKFKSKKKKVVRQAKRTCVHWIIRKGKETPTVMPDPEHPNHWKCRICGASFPIKPLEDIKETDNHGNVVRVIHPYDEQTEQMLALVNQMQFYSVKLGGDADDTKMFIKLKENLPRFAKVSKQILKRVKQRETYEKNRGRADAMTQFDMYGSFNYR